MDVSSAAIAAEQLSFGYPGDGQRLIAVSLAVQPGQVCCLLGPNGAGKTTLLRCLLGLLTPQSGTVRVAGDPIDRLSRRQLARRVAYVPQRSNTPFPFSTLDIAVTGRTPYLRAMTSPSATDRRAAACSTGWGSGRWPIDRMRCFPAGNGGWRCSRARWCRTRRC